MNAIIKIDDLNTAIKIACEWTENIEKFSKIDFAMMAPAVLQFSNLSRLLVTKISQLEDPITNGNQQFFSQN